MREDTNHFNCNRCGRTLENVTPHRLNPTDHHEVHWSVPLCPCALQDLKAAFGALFDKAAKQQGSTRLLG